MISIIIYIGIIASYHENEGYHITVGIVVIIIAIIHLRISYFHYHFIY